MINVIQRSELQSRDTLKFMESAKQALFEEILCERVWYIYFKHYDGAKAVPLSLLLTRSQNFIKMGLCKDENDFHQRLIYLTTINASYPKDQCIRMHQLPFVGNVKNNNLIASKSYQFNKKSKLGSSAGKILSQDLVDANIDRTGKLAWYRDPNTSTLMFFPGIFEPVKYILCLWSGLD